MPPTDVSLASELIVAFPKCGTPVPLTEALAAPLLEATRMEYENKLRVKDAAFEAQQDELERKEEAAAQLAKQLQAREAELDRKTLAGNAELDEQRKQLAAEVTRQTEAEVAKQLAERLLVERKAISETEERCATQRFTDELAERKRDSKDKDERIEKLTGRLTVAQNAEAELTRIKREFENREREMTLKIEQEVSAQLDQVCTVAATEAEQRLSLQISEKDWKSNCAASFPSTNCSQFLRRVRWRYAACGS